MTFQRKHYWMGALFVQMTFFGCAYPTAYPTAHPSTAHPTAHPTVHPTTTRPTIHPTVHPATVHPTSHPTTASPYIFVNVLKTWDEAEDYCQSMYDSHLATIEDDLSAQALLDGCSF
eukprot:916416_1